MSDKGEILSIDKKLDKLNIATRSEVCQGESIIIPRKPVKEVPKLKITNFEFPELVKYISPRNTLPKPDELKTGLFATPRLSFGNDVS